MGAGFVATGRTARLCALLAPCVATGLLAALLPGLLAALLACAASADERRVEIDVPGGPIVGTLEVPDAPGPHATVLLLPGFAGTRDGLAVAGADEGVLSRTARRFAEGGVASLRIDFRGVGESGGEWRDTTFSGQIADATAAYDWLNVHPLASRVAVLGWSQGGLVAAHVAAARPDAAALVLWAPAQNPLWNFSGFFGVETTMAALAAPADQEITATLPSGEETTLRALFWRELATTDPVAAAARYPGPLLVIVGSRDELVTPQPAAGEIFLRYHEGEESLVVLDTDPAFGVATGPDVLDGMIEQSLAWVQDAAAR
ncbi:alpha/beta fold hydrolase [Amaricoccus sp.]|uniref:alpha/beta hydrolase n=1 Tax=Amaricoccus sp. TaxID=1872485 RepID=UPI001B4E35E4|nr:alpha/beta fold hydrolase [Amaricoccus sp.]MBP7002210.1 alpha/beta hydrolase [Amaricoccus sp.]